MDVRCERCGAEYAADGAGAGSTPCPRCGHAAGPADDGWERPGAVRDAAEPAWAAGHAAPGRGPSPRRPASFADERPPDRREPHRSRAGTVIVLLALAVVAVSALGVLKPWSSKAPGPTLPSAPPTPAATASPTPNASPIPTPAPPPTATAKPAPPPPSPPPEPPPAPKVAPAPPKPAGVKAFISEARRLRDRGEPEAALDTYARAIEKEPNNPDALAGRGLCYLDLSQYAPAEASFQAALKADARHGAALMGLAETFRYEGRRAEAVTYYEKYLEAHPRGEESVAARNAIEALKE